MAKNSGDRQDQGKKKSPIDKLSTAFNSLKSKDNLDNFAKYAKTHVADTIAYVLMVLGIIWLFFNPFYGGILVGLVAGFYFTDEVMDLLNTFDDLLGEHGLAKNLIFAGTMLALFILAPGIFIGAAIMIGIKYLLKSADNG